jgi:N-methylhydantoinase B
MSSSRKIQSPSRRKLAQPTNSGSSFGLDPISLEIARYAFQAVVDEMSVALARSAFSINIKTRFDMSCALFDRHCRLVAQSDKIFQAGLVGALVMYSKNIRDAFGVDRMKPEDVLVVNDPFLWGTHLPDLTLFAPLFEPGEDGPIAYLMCIGHHSDFGGQTPGGLVAEATQIYQEGLIVPPVRLVKAGQLNDDVLDLMLANVRTRQDNEGDFMAQLAAIRVGSERFRELVDRWGSKGIAEFGDALIETTAARFARALSYLPPGRYYGEDWLEDDGAGSEPLRVAVELVAEGGHVTVDLSHSAKQTAGAVNCSPAIAYSKAFYAIKAMLDPNGVVNDGCYRLVSMIAPEGSIVNPRRPAATSLGWETAGRVAEATFFALAIAMPEKALAQCKRSTANSGYGGVDPRTGRQFAFFEVLGGGLGARAAKDGVDGTQVHTTNTADAQAEELEAELPILIERFEFVADSEGPGRFRGGLGLRKVVRFRGIEVVWNCPSDGRRIAPRGIFGGGDARPLRYIYAFGREDERIVEKKGMLKVPPDTPIAIESPGGGGYGPPMARSAELVLADVVLGKISIDRAYSLYGVKLTETEGELQIDHEATLKRRSQ